MRHVGSEGCAVLDLERQATDWRPSSTSREARPRDLCNTLMALNRLNRLGSMIQLPLN